MIFFRAMADKDKASGMKSAYELALERLEKQGIERPREEGLSGEMKEQVAEIRRQAEAKLAELEILHRDSLRKAVDPAKRQDRKSTRLNSSHGYISYAVFCLKKKKKKT